MDLRRHQGRAQTFWGAVAQTQNKGHWGGLIEMIQLLLIYTKRFGWFLMFFFKKSLLFIKPAFIWSKVQQNCNILKYLYYFK